MADSSTGGFLLPNASPAPLEDAALADFLQQLIVGLTGLDGSLVRPRWQPQAPNIPENTTTWASIGVHDRDADTFAYEAHDPTGDGQDFVQRHEELEVLCSFYGPQADNMASLVRDGLSLEQNRTYLKTQGMGLIGCGNARAFPEKINNLWYYRVDMKVDIRRAVTRSYKILNLLSAEGVIVTDISPLTVPYTSPNS